MDKPTEKQLKALKRFGITRKPATKKQASEWLTREIAVLVDVENGAWSDVPIGDA